MSTAEARGDGVQGTDAAATMSRRPDVPNGPQWLLRDAWTEAQRHLRVVPRNPELIAFATIQPIMFVLLFVYVFGGAIVAPGFANYNQYLLPGIMAQTVVFGSATTGIGLAEDLSKGLVDRLRSVPMQQSAVILGRTIADLVKNTFTFIIMLVVAFAVGFRFEGTLWQAFVATVLFLLFAFALSWVQALVGLSVKSVEAANSLGFLWMFPVTFVSSAFVPTDTMPSWLQPVAENNPFTRVTNAGRALYNGLPAEGAITEAFLWSFGIIIIFAFLSFRKFRETTSR
jgi:ABC-2 type transport system permease protein